MEDLMEQPATPDSAAANPGEDTSRDQPDDQDDNLAETQSSTPDQADDDSEEIEVGDKKLSIPKSAAAQLKTERMLNADYTRKTQELAAERTQVQQQAKDQQAYVREMAKVVSIDDSLAEYAKLDWASIIDSDPMGAMKLQQQQRALEAQRHQAVENLTQKEKQIALDRQQSHAKAYQDADAYMRREIPGFNQERSNELSRYAAKMGFSPEVMTKTIVRAPQVAVLMHKADLYDKLMSKQAPKPAPVTEAKPAMKVGTNATVKKDPTKMTDAEFAAYRKRTSSRK